MSLSGDVARTLRELADLHEIRGAASGAADLRRAASAVQALGGRRDRLAALARRDSLSEIPGVSPTLHWRIREMVLGGAEKALRDGLAGMPSLVRRAIERSALNTAQALELVRRFGVLTLADLGQALDDGRISRTFGSELHARLEAVADALDDELRPMTLGRACDISEDFMAAAIKSTLVEDLLPAGGVRRFEPLVTTVALVGRAAEPPAALDAVCAIDGIEDVLHRSGRRAILVYHGAEVDCRIAAPDEYGTVLFDATGSRGHVAAIVGRRGRPPLVSREEDVYAQAGLPFIPPEMRHASGEIEAADRGVLPALVCREDIRGDLHMHSTYSDGRDAMHQMVATCAALGYEYIAITDHSERAGASRTVDAEALARQADEISRLRERFPELEILHGVEVDIMPDGRLDFADAVLAKLDIVLASLHDAARQDGARLTRRCVEAIRHPLVSVITHPANRLVGRHPGWDLDFNAIYAAAAQTGTALEIDGAPGHLDLDGERARAAVACGVTISIASDCHRALSLDRQMRFGIGTARRGWVEARHVLNTRSIAEVRAFIARKRRTSPAPRTS